MNILGIESSCDESAAAVVRSPRDILANVVRSQIEAHAVFGGVIPELASRLHVEYLRPAVDKALDKAGLSIRDIDLIAVTHRPGLTGCLLTGAMLAKGLAWLSGRPLVMVDHLLGHLLAPDLESPMIYPCIGGIFSGGHCNIYYSRSPLEWKMLAHTRDDAPGESFDKVAKLMELGYPGGPAIQRFCEGIEGNPRLGLPSPLPPSLEGDFSFSGIKTAVLYHLKGLQGRSPLPKEHWPHLAAGFQLKVAEALSARLVECALENDTQHIYVGGGVAANRVFRDTLSIQAGQKGLASRFAPLPLCMDNAAMIAHAGRLMFENDVSCVAGSLGEDVSSRSELGFAG